MPTTIAELFAAAGLIPEDVVRWGTPPHLKSPGVYVVALTQATDDANQTLPRAPVARTAIDQWLQVRPELALDGARPSADQLSARLEGFWLPDEVALYIGRATSLAHRLKQYYTTPLGARRPHAGGYFLKLLANLNELWVHYAECDEPVAAESRMLRTFCEHVSEATRQALRDPHHPFPFANLEWPNGVKKAHGLRGAKSPRRAPDLRVEIPEQGKPEQDSAGASTTSVPAAPAGCVPIAPTAAAVVQVARPVTTAGRASAALPARSAPPAGSCRTQQVTDIDLTKGRIRIPALSTTPTRKLLPPGKAVVCIVLRGRPVDCQWDPHTGPDRQRSGVLKVGPALRDLVSPGEVLQVTPNPDGRLALD